MNEKSDNLFYLSMMMKNHCIVYRWRMLSRLLTNVLDEALRPLNLTSSQLNILAIVAGMRESTVGAIAYYMQMEKSSATRAVQPLLRDGLLKSHRHPDDGRVSVLSLSKKGERTFKASYKIWSEAQEEMVNILGRSTEEVDQFVSAAIGRGNDPLVGPIPDVPDQAFERAGISRDEIK